MNGKTYGYIRVSSRDQNEGRQRIAMREFGIPDELVFIDKQSGKDFERPGYKQLIWTIKRVGCKPLSLLQSLGVYVKISLSK